MPLDPNNNHGERVIDPHRRKQTYQNWNRRFEGIKPENEAILLQYMDDLELGRNINYHRKGRRSYARLCAARVRLYKITRLVEQEYDKLLVDLTAKDLAKLFDKMRTGDIRRWDGRQHKAAADYVRGFKAFWHWHQKVQRLEHDRDVRDITIDLDGKDDKRRFHYFTWPQCQQLCKNAAPYYRTLMLFMFDSGIRSPTELYNVKAKDLTPMDDDPEIFHLNIRNETSKTYGRKIKLLLCSNVIREHIAENNIGPEDFLFTKCMRISNQTLKRLGYRVLGIGKIEKNKKGKEVIKGGLTMYDFRHSSACHWRPIYPTEAALKYRFGWEKDDMVKYYTEFLGMSDTVRSDAVVDRDVKTRLENDLTIAKQRGHVMEDRIQAMEKQMQTVQNALLKRAKQQILARMVGNNSAVDAGPTTE